MLRLDYSATAAGAPDTYGSATDALRGPDGTLLQAFPKAERSLARASSGLAAVLDAWIGQRPIASAPVLVMVHGYLYDPDAPENAASASPFGSVYGRPDATLPYNLSWLPIVGECDQAGTVLSDCAIAFSYTSSASASEFSAAGWNNQYQYAALDLSPLAARALATVLDHLIRRGIPIRILAHSLGTRTVSQAMRLLGGLLPGTIQRVVLLHGAEFSVDAAKTLLDRGFDVINVTNGNDQVLFLGGKSACHPFRENNALDACVIGIDGLGDYAGWLDLRVDRPEVIAWFRDGNAPNHVHYDVHALALENSHKFAGMNHWSCYTNDGNRALLRDLLLDDTMTVAALKQAGIPAGTGTTATGRFVPVGVPSTPSSRAERRALLDNTGINPGNG